MLFRASPDTTLTGHTLVLPALSIGNVPQLCVDLVVSTLGARKAGDVDHPALLPVCGCDAYSPLNTGSLSSSLEIRTDSQSSVTLIQQRAPPAPGRAMEFGRDVVAWASTLGFKELVVLVSGDAGRVTSARDTPRYVCGAGFDEGRVAGLGWRPLEDTLVSAAIKLNSTTASVVEECRAKGVPFVVVVMLCSEGDNTPDAVRMAAWLNALVLHMPESTRMKQPESWGAPTFWGNRVETVGASLY
eukprot:m51a1_g11026 hypothetical protein (244) ;mRNA; f:414069-414965